jgi:hypothetical protein
MKKLIMMLILGMMVAVSGCGSTAGMGSGDSSSSGSDASNGADDSVVVTFPSEGVALQGAVVLPDGVTMATNAVIVRIFEGDVLIASENVVIENGVMNVSGLIDHYGTYSIAVFLVNGPNSNFIWSKAEWVVDSTDDVVFNDMVFSGFISARAFVNYDSAALTQHAVTYELSGKGAAFNSFSFFVMYDETETEKVFLAYLPLGDYSEVILHFSAMDGDEVVVYQPVVLNDVSIAGRRADIIFDNDALPLVRP